MSGETVNNQQVDTAAPEVAEAIEKIKQPPSINEMLMQGNPEELISNPAVVPEMLNESTDLRGDLRRDE
jgi:hypothetical protein